MSKSQRPDNILLTGADCFILALEKRTNVKGTTGNICKYVMDLKGRLDAVAFTDKIKNHKGLQWLASLYVKKASPVSRPVWKTNPKVTIDVNIHESDVFPGQIHNRKMDIEKPGMLHFDIIYRSSGNTCIVFSWNHLIMDGYGAVLLLKQLNSGKDDLVSNGERIEINIASIREAVKAKFFIGRSKKNILSGLSPAVRHKEVHQKTRVVRFSEEETAKIWANGPCVGAKFGPSPFYLACSARAVKEILTGRGTKMENFWIPVPQNTRKKGAAGPVLGNHISFLFYLLGGAHLASIETAVKEISEQMIQQVKLGTHKSFAVLIHYLRRIPYSLYRHYTSGPNGGSLSSFQFTVAEDHPEELMTFQGHEIIEAFSFPPNIYPPGFTFAFMRFGACLHILMLYYEEVISEAEADKLEIMLRNELVLLK